MESRIWEKARDALKQILEAASYNVEEVGDPQIFSALKDDSALLVLCSDDPDAIAMFDSMNYHLNVDGDDLACKKLLFTLDPDVQTEDCIRWGADEFTLHAGRAALADLLGQTLILDLSRPMRESERDSWLGTDNEADMPLEEDEEEEMGPELPHLPLQVSEKRACGIAGLHGSAKCRFIPYWGYRYASTGEREVKDRVVSFEAEGRGAINAINGLKMKLDPEAIVLSAIPSDSEILQARLVLEDVKEQVTQEVIDRLTQRVRFRYEKGDAIYYEEKTLKPDRNNIQVDLDTIYVPVWQVRGGSRIVEVNGYTGEILAIPMDEGVELL